VVDSVAADFAVAFVVSAQKSLKVFGEMPGLTARN
jgi:hypothetical protein